jgi:hypothetical protein
MSSNKVTTLDPSRLCLVIPAFYEEVKQSKIAVNETKNVQRASQRIDLSFEDRQGEF